MPSPANKSAAFPVVRLVVYDLDGTLIDSFEDIWNNVNTVFGRFGLAALPFERVKAAVGDGLPMLLRRCLGEENAGRYDEIYPALRLYYKEHPAGTVRLYPGVAETLARVRELGLRQAILTNKPDEVAAKTCASLGLDRLVDAIQGEQDGRPRKPEAESLLILARRFGVAAAECVLVGDGPADHAVARAAGARMFGATWGQLDERRTQALRPAAVLRRMEELIGALGLGGDGAGAEISMAGHEED